MTSPSTVDEPTPAEIATRHTFNMMWETTVDALKKFCEKKKKDRKVPSPTYNAYMTYKEDGSWTNNEMTYENWTYEVKPLYDYSTTINQKTGEKYKDYTKPMQTYIKLLTKGKGKNIGCETNSFGPGDKKRSPFKYMGIHGACHPVVHWDGIFWGPHGPASYGASIRLRVTEMNFSPGVMKRSVPHRRMLEPKLDENESDDEST